MICHRSNDRFNEDWLPTNAIELTIQPSASSSYDVTRCLLAELDAEGRERAIDLESEQACKKAKTALKMRVADIGLQCQRNHTHRHHGHGGHGWRRGGHAHGRGDLLHQIRNKGGRGGGHGRKHEHKEERVARQVQTFHQGNNLLSAIRQGDVDIGRGLLAEAIDTHPQHFEAAVRALNTLEMEVQN